MDFTFTDEQQMLRDTYRGFAKKELTPEYVRFLDEETDFLPEDMYQRLAAMGTMGICIPEEYGGMGLGHIEHCIVTEELSYAGVAVGFGAGIAEVFGGRPILAMGNEAQKQEHLPRIVEGKEKWALAMTEPDGGTDILGAIRTTAVKKGDEYVVNGAKMWISGAHVADYLTTLVITDKEVERKKGLSVLIIDAKSPGIEIRPIKKLGIHGCGTNEIYFDDLHVPVENLLGEENRGWYGLLEGAQPRAHQHVDLLTGHRPIGVRLRAPLRAGAQGLRQDHRFVPDPAALPGRHRRRDRERPQPHLQVRLAVRHGPALRRRGLHGEDRRLPRLGARRSSRHGDHGRLRLRHGVRHAAPLP